MSISEVRFSHLFFPSYYIKVRCVKIGKIVNALHLQYAELHRSGFSTWGSNNWGLASIIAVVITF